MKLSTIYTTLAQIRRERGISQSSLAAALNVEQAAVSLYENGKRGISLDLLDRWFSLLEIDAAITPKGYEPVKDQDAVQEDLREFVRLKHRRNYLIAEMRSAMAVRIMQEPSFLRKRSESGDNLFWVYAFHGNAFVGIVETRFDHPNQRHLAVEYTEDGVNVYKFSLDDTLNPREVDHIYYSEADFLSFGSFSMRDMMDSHRVTIIRTDTGTPEGLKLLNSEGFPIRSLLEMQENQKNFVAVCDEVAGSEWYRSMRDELFQVEERLADLALENRLGNGQASSAFSLWTEDDEGAVSVPLNDEKRAWRWIEEGAKWEEGFYGQGEIRISSNAEAHENHPALLDEGSNRVIGMIGAECRPALLKRDPTKPGVLYFVESSFEDLSEDELRRYKAMLESSRASDKSR